MAVVDWISVGAALKRCYYLLTRICIDILNMPTAIADLFGEWGLCMARNKAELISWLFVGWRLRHESGQNEKSMAIENDECRSVEGSGGMELVPYSTIASRRIIDKTWRMNTRRINLSRNIFIGIPWHNESCGSGVWRLDYHELFVHERIRRWWCHYNKC